jgi:predicted enzyme related to lactoylglutathione lyase
MGGAVILEKSPIPGIGWVMKFRDTEGNEVAVVEYHGESQ